MAKIHIHVHKTKDAGLGPYNAIARSLISLENNSSNWEPADPAQKKALEQVRREVDRVGVALDKLKSLVS